MALLIESVRAHHPSTQSIDHQLTLTRHYFLCSTFQHQVLLIHLRSSRFLLYYWLHRTQVIGLTGIYNAETHFWTLLVEDSVLEQHPTKQARMCYRSRAMGPHFSFWIFPIQDLGCPLVLPKERDKDLQKNVVNWEYASRRVPFGVTFGGSPGPHEGRFSKTML